jgi:Mg2+ and Co2+ transporter CorA
MMPVLIALLACLSCKLGGGGLDEANKLNQSAGQDIDEIEKIIQDNKNKEGAVTRAVNAGQTDAAKKLMDDTIAAIDRGLERGKSAADKLDKASKLNIDQAIKDYLSYRAQSVTKAIEAFTELRKGIIAFRDSVGSTDKAVVAKARNDIQQTSQSFDALISESQRLQSKADEIARRNPDKIKPGQ